MSEKEQIAPKQKARIASDRVFPDILSLLRHKASEIPDRVALDGPSDLTLTYNGLLAHTESLVIALIAQGVGNEATRSRIGMVLPNGSELSKALLAVASIGIAIPFNPGYTASEFERYFRETGIQFLLTIEGFSNTAMLVAHQLGITVLDLGQLCDAMAVATEKIIPPRPDDVAMILLTSGSTGQAKKVPLTHQNVCTSARDVCQSMGLVPSDRCLSMWEQFHVGGLVDLLLAPLHSGGTVIVTSGFDAALFFSLLVEKQPSWFQGVPTTLGELTDYAHRHKILPQQSSLRLLRSVAAALPPAQMLKLESLFNVPVLQTFGMTEAAPLITSTRLPPAIRKPGSVGIPCGTEVAIFAPNGTLLTNGSSGEVGIRGKNVFSGYENDPESNAVAFCNGWFLTGDIGQIDDDGHLFLTGRIKEIINRGGQKILPQEVENALMAHPDVTEAVVFPMPHPSLEETVAAVFISATGNGPSEFELRLYLSRRLIAYKVPQRILRVESIPRGPTGKVKRSDLFGHFQDQLTTHATTALPLLGDMDPDLEAVRTELLLKRHPEILDCAVIPMPTRHGGVNLIAFIVNRGKFTWRSFLDLLLQSGTVCIAPANFVGLKVLPMNPDQLVNRQALAEYALRLDANPHPSEIPEIMLAAICRSVLGVERIKMQDDLFTLGVDSLKIVDLLVTIEREFGRAVSPETLFRQPTLEGLLQALQEDSSRAAESALIEIQRGSSTAPFFFIHGDYNGGGFHCRRLARLLGSDSGLVTFIPHGQPGQQIPTSIEAMAEQYLPLIRNYQPVGPYRLGGHCNGALVALEIARRLVAEGQATDRLVLISPPPIDTIPVTSDSLSTVSEPMLECTLRYQPTAVRRGILNELYRRAIHRYIARRFDGKTSLLMTAVDIGNAPDPSRGWLKLLPQAKIHRIPGEHLNIFTKHLPILASALRHCLNES